MEEQTKTRMLKVYNQSRGDYSNIPTIIPKGHWLKEYGFKINDTIKVLTYSNGVIIIKKI